MFGRSKRLNTNIKPSPPDDAPPGDGYFNAGWQNGSLDDDSRHIHQYAGGRRMGDSVGDRVPGYIPGYATLWGDHFRVGYHGYIGVQDPYPLESAQGEVYLGPGLLKMRPPIIPRRTATPASVRNAITFVQSMPGQTWYPIIPPLVSRR